MSEPIIEEPSDDTQTEFTSEEANELITFIDGCSLIELKKIKKYILAIRGMDAH